MSLYGTVMCVGFLISLAVSICLIPLETYILWKNLCKKYGEETAHEMWRRW